MATATGVDLKTTNSQNNVSTLIANVQTFISQGVKGVVMAPQDTAAIAPSLGTLESKKIPVVTIDTRPDTGNVFMVVRADNKAYGTKACQFLGTKLGGKGKVIMFQGDLASINGRDRTDAFNDCMKSSYPGIKVFGEASNWDGATAASQFQTQLASDPDIKGVYMESSFALAGTLQVLRQHNLLVPPTDPKHVFVVSNDGIPEELKDIGAGQIDATVSQPADLYAKYGLFYAKAAIDGKTFQPGPTDHDSNIIQVRPGVLEDQLSAPLVTLDGATIGGAATLKFDDKSLWGNAIQ
jgi:simple sugar transport system substrate-binding protein/ribose transport system substrate-binding protein